MIRPTVPADTPTLVAIAESTGVFKPLEIDALKEVLHDYHEWSHAHHHKAISYLQDDRVIAFAYYAPAAMTDRTWYLYWIAVDRTIQAKGIGSELLKFIEEDIRKVNGRVLLIETSSLPVYDLTRKFYVRQGYEQEAMLRDYYADGDAMVVFRKHF